MKVIMGHCRGGKINYQTAKFRVFAAQPSSRKHDRLSDMLEQIPSTQSLLYRKNKRELTLHWT